MPPPDDSVRRIDWRFLLDDPRPGIVTLIGAPDDQLVADAFCRLGSEVLGANGGRRGADVVFSRDPGLDAVRASLEHRAPDGSIVFETTSRRARRAVARRLQRERLCVTQYGCWPSCRDATRFVPLHDRSELITSATVAKNRRRRAVGTLLARLGLGSQLFREATTVATAPEAARPPAPQRVAFGDEPLRSAALTLLTPRFGSSRHVIAFCTDDRGRRLVVKTPRIPGDDTQVARESRGLTSIEGVQPLRPSLVTDTEVLGQRWLVQTCVNGVPLTRRHVERDPHRWLSAAQRWLEHMPTRGRSTPDDDGRAERLVRPALDLISACAEREPDLGSLLADAERALDRLRATPLPIVAEHGDFRPPNLIITRPGVLGVVDWELAEPSGFPLYDLTFFHAFVVEVAPHVGADVRKAGVDAVVASGLDADLLDALRSLAMLRQLANLVERGTQTIAATSPAVAHSDVARSWFATLEDR